MNSAPSCVTLVTSESMGQTCGLARWTGPGLERTFTVKVSEKCVPRTSPLYSESNWVLHGHEITLKTIGMVDYKVHSNLHTCILWSFENIILTQSWLNLDSILLQITFTAHKNGYWHECLVQVFQKFIITFQMSVWRCSNKNQYFLNFNIDSFMFVL